MNISQTVSVNFCERMFTTRCKCKTRSARRVASIVCFTYTTGPKEPLLAELSLYSDHLKMNDAMVSKYVDKIYLDKCMKIVIVYTDCKLF
uniref:Uncharacterized protein n=2 Tax=Anguilla anguilla TaxID=7936 RepID=A0A0E9QCD8_ANGAN